MYTFIVFITLLLFLQNDDMSHNMVFSRVSLGCCINLHCAMLLLVHWSSPIEPSLSKWICRKISIQYKKTQKEGQRFFLSFSRLIYHESIYLKQTGPMSKPNSWSAPPMSKGAMSRMGRRDGLFVLYSMTVLLHWPVRFCRDTTKRQNRLSKGLLCQTSHVCCCLNIMWCKIYGPLPHATLVVLLW